MWWRCYKRAPRTPDVIQSLTLNHFQMFSRSRNLHVTDMQLISTDIHIDISIHLDRSIEVWILSLKLKKTSDQSNSCISIIFLYSRHPNGLTGSQITLLQIMLTIEMTCNDALVTISSPFLFFFSRLIHQWKIHLVLNF